MLHCWPSQLLFKGQILNSKGLKSCLEAAEHLEIRISVDCTQSPLRHQSLSRGRALCSLKPHGHSPPYTGTTTHRALRTRVGINSAEKESSQNHNFKNFSAVSASQTSSFCTYVNTCASKVGRSASLSRNAAKRVAMAYIGNSEESRKEANKKTPQKPKQAESRARNNQLLTL